MKKIILVALVAALQMGNALAFSSSDSRTRVDQTQQGTQRFRVGSGAQGPVLSTIDAQQLQDQMSRAKSSASAGTSFKFDMPMPM